MITDERIAEIKRQSVDEMHKFYWPKSIACDPEVLAIIERMETAENDIPEWKPSSELPCHEDSIILRFDDGEGYVYRLGYWDLTAKAWFTDDDRECVAPDDWMEIPEETDYQASLSTRLSKAEKELADLKGKADATITVLRKAIDDLSFCPICGVDWDGSLDGSLPHKDGCAALAAKQKSEADSQPQREGGGK